MRKKRRHVVDFSDATLTANKPGFYIRYKPLMLNSSLANNGIIRAVNLNNADGIDLDMDIATRGTVYGSFVSTSVNGGGRIRLPLDYPVYVRQKAVSINAELYSVDHCSAVVRMLNGLGGEYLIKLPKDAIWSACYKASYRLSYLLDGYAATLSDAEKAAVYAKFPEFDKVLDYNNHRIALDPNTLPGPIVLDRMSEMLWHLTTVTTLSTKYMTIVDNLNWRRMACEDVRVPLCNFTVSSKLEGVGRLAELRKRFEGKADADLVERVPSYGHDNKLDTGYVAAVSTTVAEIPEAAVREQVQCRIWKNYEPRFPVGSRVKLVTHLGEVCGVVLDYELDKYVLKLDDGKLMHVPDTSVLGAETSTENKEEINHE